MTDEELGIELSEAQLQAVRHNLKMIRQELRGCVESAKLSKDNLHRFANASTRLNVLIDFLSEDGVSQAGYNPIPKDNSEEDE